MPFSRTGHFVQVHRETGPAPHEYVTVLGRSVARTVGHHPTYFEDGWYPVSRELDRKSAVKYAKAYKRNGFPSRVVFRGNAGEEYITDQFEAQK